MATTNDLKNGMTLDIEKQLWNVVEFQHVKPGKGPAFVRTKLKSVMTGKVIDRTFNAGNKIDVAILELEKYGLTFKPLEKVKERIGGVKHGTTDTVSPKSLCPPTP